MLAIYSPAFRILFEHNPLRVVIYPMNATSSRFAISAQYFSFFYGLFSVVN